MTPAPGYVWKLRQVMAAHAMWKTSDLGPLLAERGVVLSSAQVYRLCAKVPERLSLRTLAALCDIFSCEPNDLIEIVEHPRGRPRRHRGAEVADLATIRPRRARVDPGTS